VAQDDGRTVSLERSREHHGAGLHGAHRRARLRADPDSVPAQHRAVRAQLAAEPVDHGSLDGPLQRARVRGRERGGGRPRGGRGGAALELDAAPLQVVDHAPHPALVGFERGEPGLGLALAAPELVERALVLVLERAELRDLADARLP
jgi:hypothetical protein